MKNLSSVSQILLSISSILILMLDVSFAREIFMEPAIHFTAGHEDNPRLQSTASTNEGMESSIGDGQSIFVFGADVRIGSESQIDLFAIDLSGDIRKNSDSDLDSESLSGIVVYQKTGQYKDYSLEAGMSQDSTLETELADTGRLASDVDRKELFFRPSSTIRFSPELIGDFEMGYGKVTFDGSELDFTEYSERSGSARISRTISERLSALASTSLILYQPSRIPDDGEIERDIFFDILLGFDYALSPITILSFSAGPSRTRTELAGPNENTASNDGAVYSLSIEHSEEISNYSLELFRTSQSSAVGGLVEVQGLNLGWSRRVSERVDLGVDTTYTKRESNAVGSDEREYISFSPSISWNLNRRLTLSIQARYSEQEFSESELVASTSSADTVYYSLGLQYDFGRKSL